MFGFIGDIAKGVGSIVGAVVGPVVGISVAVIASTLGITIAMVNEAVKAGCESYEDIRDYHDL